MKGFYNWCKTYISIPGVVVIAAIVYMVFFQENSMSKIYTYDRAIDSLRAEIKVQNDTMRFYQELNHRMDNRDPEIIEQIVREHHNMTRVNEDVYIVD